MPNLVDSWLIGIGLGYAVPIFAGQGINSPDALSELDVVDFPELGISDQNDRKKLFYLIQRVKLALDRGRAAEKKSAPQADSAVSSTAPAEASRVTARAKEDNGVSAAPSSVRFRRELEVPAARAAVSPRAGGARNASASDSNAGGGADGRVTPAKVQRLPPSHRRPKTPHADGTVPSRQQQQQQQQQQPPQSPGGARTSSTAADGRARQKAPVGRLVAAAGSDGVAVLAVEHETSVQVFPERRQQDGDVGGGCSGAVSGTLPGRPSSPRPKASDKPYNEQHRSVLEPVQLDEAGGRTRVASSSSSTATDERRLMPPPQGTCTGQADRPAVQEAPEAFGRHTVAKVTTVPPQPPRGAQERSTRGDTGPSRRPPPEELRDTSPRNAAAAVPPLPTREVARLKRDTAPASSISSSSSSDRTPWRMETPGGDESSVGTLPVAGRNGERSTAVPRAFPSLSDVEAGTGEGNGRDSRAAGAAAAENGRRESAAELAVHLISAHREDVRSALAAARKDMDLVSKADKDRQPATLMEYAREVEGVLGQRMAAGAKLRQALDSYLTLRQAAGAAGAATPNPRSEGHGLQEGQRRAGGRALRT